MTKKSMVSEAQTKVLQVANAWKDAQEYCNALATFGNRMCHSYIGKTEFFDGLSKMQSAIRHEYVEAANNVLMMACIDNEKIIDFSKKMFQETFSEDEKYCVMQFLSDNGRLPLSWGSGTEEEFRKEAKDFIKSSQWPGRYLRRFPEEMAGKVE